MLLAAFSATLPVAPELITGATVSMLILGTLPETRPLLPAASVNELDRTVILVLPLVRLAEGVKNAVRVRPVPLMVPRLPLLTTTSLLVNVVPGSSLKVKVMVAVWPTPTFDLLLVIVRLGARVSVGISDEMAPVPRLPERSAYAPSATMMLALRLPVLAVGVNVAVRVRPEPLKPERVPPFTVTSEAEKLLPGSWLKVKVMVADSPDLIADLLLLICSVGAVLVLTSYSATKFWLVADALSAARA